MFDVHRKTDPAGQHGTIATWDQYGHYVTSIQLMVKRAENMGNNKPCQSMA